jgi:transposase-like protein
MSIDLIRALLLARQLADEALQDAIRDWIAAGNAKSQLAVELGIDRSTLYRRYVWEDSSRCGQGRPEAGDSEPLTAPNADKPTMDDGTGGSARRSVTESPPAAAAPRALRCAY